MCFHAVTYSEESDSAWVVGCLNAYCGDRFVCCCTVVQQHHGSCLCTCKVYSYSYLSFSYPARRYLHARDRRRRHRLHSSGIRRAGGHRRGIRRASGHRHGIRNASGHRLRGCTSDLLSSQLRPELGGSPLETGFCAAVPSYSSAMALVYVHV
jgi:hypothetical protein